MLKRFGYTNLMVLGIGIAVLLLYVDFQQPSKLDMVLMSLFGLTVVIHLLRLVMIIVTMKVGK
ncbi:MAG TPA: hypothetical protein GX525_11930 [Bacilli bacterium]|nr:hypothetical protein [Bacilli bacterium]